MTQRHFARPVVSPIIISLLLVSMSAGAPPVAPGDRNAADFQASAETADYEIVIYGGTSAGVIAAVQASTLGKSVVLVEPGQHLGGLSSGGLGATDIGNKAAIGGLSREFYRRVRTHYDQPKSWVFEQASDYRSPRQSRGEDTMWTFEPRVAEVLFEQFCGEADIEVIRGARLDRENGVELDGTRILSITMESGLKLTGAMFIDATYEGDLLAAAGVSYHVGRESIDQYDESLNGVQTGRAIHHQLVPGVDPYVEPGRPESGLLPGIDPEGPGEEGSGDLRVQAYCLRMCVTDVPENQIPFVKPDDYDPLDYELLLRNFEAGADQAPWHPTMMPNRKTDANNNRGVSTDYISMSYAWPEADYDTRQAVYEQHLHYQQGLMWTLANHPRVPDAIRGEFQRWGNCRDEFTEHGGWSPQLYVREARRMVSDYVMTQHDCEARRTADDSIGLAAYTMDSHHVQRFIDEHGHVQNEGDVQVGGFAPYPISYRSVVPRAEECTNLLVPVCLSSSHIAFGSIRMEPVFMVLGQSTATAACLAIDQQCSVQEVDYAILRDRLLADGQVLEWTGPRPEPVFAWDKADLEGIVLDDVDARKAGSWTSSRSVPGFVGQSYLHDGNESKGESSVTFETVFEEPGAYEVLLAATPHSNRATSVPIEIAVDGLVYGLQINQRQELPVRESFIRLIRIDVERNSRFKLVVSNEGTDGFVIADAVWLRPVDR